ncbi:MAG: LysR family transcriptional regulator [Pseudomonadota bacterium]
MNLNGLDLNLLVALDALLQHRNVTRAGEQLHITQSAMSGCLARLRAHFGDPLLVPLGRQLHLTSVADALVRPVRAILIQIEAVVQTQPVFEPAASSRQFRIMASDYGATVLIADLLRQIRDTAPNVGVEIVPFSDAPSHSLEEGDIDLLLSARELLAADHPSEVLFKDDFVCLAWAGNRRIGKHPTLAQFLGLAHVVVKYGKHSVSHMEERFFRSTGFHRRVEVVVSSFNTVPHMVVGTHRIATIHRRLALLYAATLPLKVLALPVRPPTIEQSMQWHAHRESDPGGAWLRAQTRAVANGLRHGR